MGRRKRRVVHVVKKKLPLVFLCPKCGEEAVRVHVDKISNLAIIQCGSCGVREELEASPALAPIDYYNKFCDRTYLPSKPEEAIKPSA